MLFGASLQTLVFATFALSSSPWTDYIAFIGIGFGGTIYRPASSAMVPDLLPKENLREVFATFTTANNIGAVLGPSLGAIFFFHYRYQLLWTCASFFLLYLIAIYFMIHETKPHSVKNTKAGIPLILKEQIKGYIIIFHDKVFWVYIFSREICFGPYYAVGSLFTCICD